MPQDFPIKGRATCGGHVSHDAACQFCVTAQHEAEGRYQAETTRIVHRDAPAAKADTLLPTDKQARKDAPVVRGFLDYFPRAIVAVAELSRIANEQHNPGEPLHWSKEKSNDHADCLVRHLIERGTMDTDGVRHSAKVAWRALANLEIELETEAANQENSLRFARSL